MGEKNAGPKTFADEESFETNLSRLISRDQGVEARKKAEAAQLRLFESAVVPRNPKLNSGDARVRGVGESRFSISKPSDAFVSPEPVYRLNRSIV